ncbi:MAG: DUF106 domain-containing protein [Promethearchaeota archaeon]|nr:MAG: DUF106 domain-containing protein [Candidatus Lokiarchaeota archaeon]
MKCHFYYIGDQTITNVAVILQILFITLGMVVFGLVLNKILGINPDAAKEIQEEAKNLQNQMRTAQALGDYQMMRQLQRESMQLTRQMMTKQFLPQCLRLILFLVIFYVIGFIYADYSSGLLPFTIFGDNGWFSVYLIFSIAFSLFYYLLRRINRYRKENEDPWKLNKMGLIKFYSNKINYDETPMKVDLP